MGGAWGAFSSMIIDCCMFYNEVSMLDLRLHELNSVVDKFVIVEAEETIGSGQKRKAVLPDNWEIIKPFENKVHYKLLPKLEPPFTGLPGDPWGRERFQRNQLLTAALELNPQQDDTLIISDVDEIPDPKVIIDNIYRLDKGICRLAMKFFYYNVNNFLGTWTRGSTMGQLSHYVQVSPEDSRYKNQDNEHIIENAGWHFSFFGGVDNIKDKVTHYSHALDGICTDLRARDDKELIKDVLAGQDLFRREGMNKFIKTSTFDPTLPKFYLNNLGRYKQFTEEYFVEKHRHC
jgi:beta-1,4-mannosyl-glycoprotein beta-1,4-N-acetylglucosaminyltransferase